MYRAIKFIFLKNKKKNCRLATVIGQVFMYRIFEYENNFNVYEPIPSNQHHIIASFLTRKSFYYLKTITASATTTKLYQFMW